MSNKREMCQVVTLTLSDGRRVSYTGPVQIDPAVPVSVRSVTATEPIPLPEGCTFEALSSAVAADTKQGV